MMPGGRVSVKLGMYGRRQKLDETLYFGYLFAIYITFSLLYMHMRTNEIIRKIIMVKCRNKKMRYLISNEIIIKQTRS